MYIYINWNQKEVDLFTYFHLKFVFWNIVQSFGVSTEKVEIATDFNKSNGFKRRGGAKALIFRLWGPSFSILESNH